MECSARHERLEIILQRGQLRRGRPFSATVSGDPNQDGNDSMTAFPATAATRSPARLCHRRPAAGQTMHLGDATNSDFIGELVRPSSIADNQRVTITSNGLINSANTFVTNSVVANIAPYPGYYSCPQTS